MAAEVIGEDQPDALRRVPAAGENGRHERDKHALGDANRQKRPAKLPHPRRYEINPVHRRRPGVQSADRLTEGGSRFIAGRQGAQGCEQRG